MTMTCRRCFADHQDTAKRVADQFAGLGCQRLGLERADLEQIALLALWNATETHNPEHPEAMTFPGYVRAKATQSIVDAIRTHKEILCYEDGDRVADPTADTEAMAEAAEMRKRMLAAVRRLPPRMRAIVEGRLEGRGLREVGATLGVSESRACQIEAAAIELLRSRMRRGNRW